MPRGSQLSRQWRLLQLLDAPAGVTVEDAARDLDCAVRTIWRDLRVLEDAGFPIYDELASDGRRGLADQSRLQGPAAGQALAVRARRPRHEPARAGAAGGERAGAGGRYIRERFWHPSQRFRDLSGGRLEMTLRVADTLEVRRWILGYGADAEVVEPDGLRETLRQEAESLARLLVPGRRPLAGVTPGALAGSRRRPAKTTSAVE